MRTHSIFLAPALLVAGLTACTPATAPDASNESSLTRLVPNAQPSGVTLSTAAPSYSLAFSCPASAGQRCLVNFDFGLAESSVIAHKSQVVPQTVTSVEGVQFATRSLFFDAVDGRKNFDYGWSDPLDSRGAPSFTDSEGTVISPGDHVLVLTREPKLPPGFPDLHLHITMTSRVVCDGDSCPPSGSTPDDPPDVQTATLIGTLQSASSVDGQAIPLSGADVILRSATADQQTTSAGDGSFSFEDVPLGSYVLVVNGEVMQDVEISSAGLVDLGVVLD